jgi:hypothetical protein
MSSNQAEQALYQDLLSIYARAGAEVTYETDDGSIRPYWAKRFLQAVKRSEKNHDLFGFVDRLLKPEQPSRGFLILKKAGRLDLTVEALIIDAAKPYYGEIPFELIASARRRLADHGYEEAFTRPTKDGKSSPSEEESARSSSVSSLMPGTSFDVRVTVNEGGSLSLVVI